jgi:hypothetical protein
MQEVRLDEDTVRKYLLGGLAVDEREQLEERLLTDDDFFNSLSGLEEEVEDELIDEYISGDLITAERENFELIFLCTRERREKLKLAMDLREHKTVPAVVASASGRLPWRHLLPAFLRFQNPLIGFSLALALLLVSLYGVWLYVKSNRLESELRQVQARTQAPDQEQLKQLRARNGELIASLRESEESRTELARKLDSLSAPGEKGQEGLSNTSHVETRTTPSPSRPAILSLILPLARGRDAQGEKIKVLNLPAGTTKIRLALSLGTIDPGGYKGFQASVENGAETEIWKSAVVSARHEGGENQVVLNLPASLLSAEGDYTVTLNGLTHEGLNETVGMYLFRVVRK